jgi:hypothetical protein
MPVENDANKEKCCIIKENQKAQNSHEHEMMHNEMKFFLAFKCVLYWRRREERQTQNKKRIFLVMDGEVIVKCFA